MQEQTAYQVGAQAAVPGGIEWSLVGERHSHDQKIIEWQPFEQGAPLGAQRVPTPEQQQRYCKIGCVDHIVLHCAQRHHCYKKRICVVPACTSSSSCVYWAVVRMQIACMPPSYTPWDWPAGVCQAGDMILLECH